MKVVLVSDSHGDTGILKKIDMIENADVNICCGDTEATPVDIRPFINVKGNCDYFEYPISRVLNLEEERIFITHGNTLSLHQMIDVTKSHQCNVLMYGHTHKYEERFVDSVLVLNPGSVSRPRDGSVPTYMVLDITSEGIKVEKREVRF